MVCFTSLLHCCFQASTPPSLWPPLLLFTSVNLPTRIPCCNRIETFIFYFSKRSAPIIDTASNPAEEAATTATAAARIAAVCTATTVQTTPTSSVSTGGCSRNASTESKPLYVSMHPPSNCHERSPCLDTPRLQVAKLPYLQPGQLSWRPTQTATVIAEAEQNAFMRFCATSISPCCLKLFELAHGMLRQRQKSVYCRTVASVRLGPCHQ